MRVVESPTACVFVCDSFVDGMRGVIGRESLLDTGMVVIPFCNWVHTFFVKRSIQLFFFDERFQMVKHIRELKPWRFSPLVWSARYTVECSATVSCEDVERVALDLGCSLL